MVTVLIRAVACPSVISMQIFFGQNQLIGSGDIEHNITFWSKFSVFLSAVTLKVRSRPQSGL